MVCGVAFAQNSVSGNLDTAASQEEHPPQDAQLAAPAREKPGLETAPSSQTGGPTGPSFKIPATRQSQTALPDSGAYLTQVFLALMVVIGLVFAVGWLMRRVGGGALVGSQHMKVLATMPMGTRERVALIDVAGQQLLVGVTATSINTLHVFPEPVIESDHGAADSDFAHKLRALMGGKGQSS
jgi:flagellar biosynthetic protein FliO